MSVQKRKKMKRVAIERLLGVMAGSIVRRKKPLVVGVTGSVGKTSAKEAAALVLARTLRVRKSEGNFNNEIGVPLTVLGVGSGDSALVRLLSAAFGYIRLLLPWSAYPEALVIEMGVDRPGDMRVLTGIVPVRIGVLTRIAESHLEHFGTITAIAKEKGRLIASLPSDGFAILNADDPRVAELSTKTKAVPIMYGFGASADVRADNLSLQETEQGIGFTFKLNYKGKTIPVRLPHVIARHHIEDVLAGAAVGIAIGMNLVEIAGALGSFGPSPGRLRFLQGRDGIGILDDTYNASPASVRAALSTLREVPARRKVVVLGDMLELGSISEEEHRALAEAITASGATSVVLVGNHVRFLADELLLGGLSRSAIHRYPDPDSAALSIGDVVCEGDLVLVKGSQGLRMEKVSAALLRDPKDAVSFLCRQTAFWYSKPFSPPAEWGGSGTV